MRDDPNRFRKYAQRIFLAYMAVLVLVVILGSEAITGAAVWLALLGLVVYLVLLLLFWRCPYCGRNFPTRAYEELTFCPHCGQKLPTSEK